MNRQHTYTFDFYTSASLTIEADSEEVARMELAGAIDCASTNFGADSCGDALVGETSIIGKPILALVDGGDLSHYAELDGVGTLLHAIADQFHNTTLPADIIVRLHALGDDLQQLGAEKEEG